MSNPELRRAVWAADSERIAEQFQLATAAAGRDVELWHTLAILAREDATARPPEQRRSVDTARIVAAELWTLLLTEPEFSGEADAAFRRELVEDLLVTQKARFTQALAEGDLETARLCLRCLTGIRGGVTDTRALLVKGPFSAFRVNEVGRESEFGSIAERSERLIDEWGADLVAASERKLTDSAAIKQLGENSKLDKNYEGAIKELEIVVRLRARQRHALRAALKYGFEWWVCMHNQGETHAALAAIDTVTPFAELLEPMCTPGRAHAAENKALCEYHYGMGLARMRLAKRIGNDELLDQSLVDLQKAGSWDPDDDAVRRELARGRGRRLFGRGDYAEAERVLRDVRDNGRELAVLFNDYGIDRLNDARALLKIARNLRQLDAAQDPADESERMLIQAGKLDPNDQVIVHNVQLIKDLKKDIEQTRRRLELA